ncbi:hypothetical protein [Paraburkholderia sp. BL6665CI2N2]|uniref:hypothetical protein n=1 Tax=Paraburkholderia sp. BL6665CI2N2 TaxID=1938806 RepID=UPI001065052E|nr:hypothetical protein [Paraburkholderia sp. BL6665CI2N2]
MDLNNDMTTRVMELLGHNDAAQIRKARQDLHRRLAFIGGSYPQVAAVAVFGAGGELLASSRYFPVAEVSIAHRDDFGAAQAS